MLTSLNSMEQLLFDDWFGSYTTPLLNTCWWRHTCVLFASARVTFLLCYPPCFQIVFGSRFQIQHAGNNLRLLHQVWKGSRGHGNLSQILFEWCRNGLKFGANQLLQRKHSVTLTHRFVAGTRAHSGTRWRELRTSSVPLTFLVIPFYIIPVIGVYQIS